MRRLLTSLLLATPLTLGAQEAVTLDQSLVFNYNRTEVGLGSYNGSASFQQATYQVNLGMPILEYRLGALNVGGALDYLKATNEAASDSSFGLHSIGLGGSLFPYQPYHVSFDFARITSPSLFGGGEAKSQTYGLGFAYTGSTIQQVFVDYRQGDISGDLGHQTWSTLQLKGAQNYASTIVQYRADHTTFDYQGGNRQSTSSASVDARTRLAGDWILQDNLSTQVMEGAKTATAGVNLMGTAGVWSSASAVGANYFNYQSETGTSLYADQALARSWGRLSAFAQAGVSGQQGSGTTSGTAENVTLGLTWQLAQGWTLVGDGGLASGGDLAPLGGTSTRSTSTSLHAGLSWGGGVPEVLRHALFYWSDLRFQNTIANDYPPGYVPPELATLLFERRMRREGNSQFTLDLTRLDNGASGKQDWARVSGSLSFRNGLLFRVLGDWRKDDNYFRPGMSATDKDISLSAAFSLTRTRLNLNWGYTHSDSTGLPDQTSAFPTLFLPSRSQTFASLGVDSNLGGLPWGAIYLRHVDAFGMATNSLSTHVSTSFRSVACSLTLSRGWQSNGVRDSQVIISLRRWFDTIALWGPEN